MMFKKIKIRRDEIKSMHIITNLVACSIVTSLKEIYSPR